MRKMAVQKRLNQPLIFMPEVIYMKDHEEAIPTTHKTVQDYIHYEWTGTNAASLSDVHRPPPSSSSIHKKERSILDSNGGVGDCRCYRLAICG